MLSIENKNLKTTNKYDSLSRLINQAETGGIAKNYTYDLANNKKSFILTRNGVQELNNTYNYDVVNRLTQAFDKGSLQATYAYNTDNTLRTTTLANGVISTYNYNQAGLITTMENKRGAAVISSYAYTYFLDGNQATKSEPNGKITTYTYDDLRRLSEENIKENNKTQAYKYAYDTIGNRQTMQAVGENSFISNYAYDMNNRLLTETKNSQNQTEITNFGYDKNGNQISKMNAILTTKTSAEQLVETTGLILLGSLDDTENAESNLVFDLNSYNALNQLTENTKGKTTTTYAYKPDGMRLSKTTNNQKTTHIWDGSNIVLDLNNSNITMDRYIRGINLIKSDKSGFFTYNAHGDVTALTNQTGSITKRYNYDAFGVETAKNQTDSNPFRYSGEYFDTETDSIYLRNRYYSPGTGRFLTQDPIMDGENWYAYANNNPIMFIDPFGLNKVDQDWKKENKAYIKQFQKDLLTDAFDAVDWKEVTKIIVVTSTTALIYYMLGPAGTVVHAIIIGGTAESAGFLAGEIFVENRLPDGQEIATSFVIGGAISGIFKHISSKGTGQIVKNANKGSASKIPTITDAQVGKKFGKHATDYNLPFGKEGAATYKSMTQNILSNPTEIRTGVWKTLGQSEFYIKGSDVVIVNNGEWISTFPLTNQGTLDYILSLPLK